MYFDNLTISVLIFSAILAAAIVGLTVCHGCCIKKILRKPCP